MASPHATLATVLVHPVSAAVETNDSAGYAAGESRYARWLTSVFDR